MTPDLNAVLASMEPLHIIPPPVGADVFFDVTNASYHQHYPPHPLPNHGGFWPSQSSRLIFDPRESSGGATASGDSVKTGSSTSHDPSADQRLPVDGLDGQQGRNQDENTSPNNRREWNKSRDEEAKLELDSSSEALTSPKETQVAVTLKWLSENYELSEGVCLPRCVLYVHYLDLCKRQGFKPAGAATFGKLIRQKFKNITTRRLGTRGQSKYHYYGIGIKESSVYYQAVYTGKGLTRFSGIKIKTEGSCRKYSLSSKTGTLLPEFPNAYNLILPDQESADKMEDGSICSSELIINRHLNLVYHLVSPLVEMNTFIMMYRTHSQRILDTVITANFEEIQNLLIHFWQGYPQHLQDVLQLPVMCDVVAICDSILYKVLTDVLIPNAIQDLPESLSSDLRVFLKSLPHWMQNSLDELVPESVRRVKNEVLQQFVRSMTRQLAFIKMAQTARPQMATADITNKALNDLDLIDFDQMCVQTSFAVNDKSLVNREKAKDVFEDIKNLLRKQSQIESYTEWIDSLIDKCVLQSNESSQPKFKESAGRFLLQWSMFGALVMKDLTLNNARSFSFLHVLKMTLDEYILLVMETQTDKNKDLQFQKNLQKHMKNAEEIKMNAKIRTQANKLQSSPKARKRKTESHVESEDEMDATDMEDNCPSFQPCPLSSNYHSVGGTAFLRPHPSLPTHKDSSDVSVNKSVSSQCRDMLRPSAINPNPLPLSPIKHFPSYDRPSYIPTFSFNPYSDYVNHTNSFASPRQVQTYSDHTHSQPFHPMNFNPTVNSAPSAPPTYWADTLADPYSQLGYNNYQQTYDTYKKNSLLRTPMYQDSLGRTNPTFDGLSRANATLDGLSRTNPTLDSFARPNPSFDPGRPPVYYARPSDSIQVASSMAVGSYGNSFMEITPPSGQYSRQDGLFYQEDMFASNMAAAAASGITGFSKPYFPAGFR